MEMRSTRTDSAAPPTPSMILAKGRPLTNGRGVSRVQSGCMRAPTNKFPQPSLLMTGRTGTQEWLLIQIPRFVLRLFRPYLRRITAAASTESLHFLKFPPFAITALRVPSSPMIDRSLMISVARGRAITARYKETKVGCSRG